MEWKPSHRTLHLHPFEMSMCSNSGRLREVPHFLWRDSKASKTRARLKITPREEGEIRRGERKIRDYRQSPSFWPFTVDWFRCVKFVSPFKSVTRIQWDPDSHWTVIALQVVSGRPHVIDLDQNTTELHMVNIRVTRRYIQVHTNISNCSAVKHR